MKVVHILTTFDGGAGIAAYRIFNSTRALGVDAKALVAYGKNTDIVNVIKPVNVFSRFWLIRRLQVFLQNKGIWPQTEVIRRRIQSEMDKNAKECFFSSPVTLYKTIADHPWVKEADIVHLHWVGDFLDYKSFFSKVEKPIVWGMQDENPGLGGFHYEIWKKEATDSFKSFDDELIQLKCQAMKNVKSMTMVVIASKLKEFAKRSKLLCNYPCVVINNGVEKEKFVPIPINIAREALNIPKDSRVFLFVAQNIHDKRKGLKELINALENLNMPNTLLVCLGTFHSVPESSVQIRCEGFVSNNRLQSLFYSAADYFVMPSFAEAFGQVALEALACGTPLIAFPNDGAHDLITSGNGVLCQDFTVDSLVEGIKIAMNEEYDRMKIREDAIRRFSYDKIGKQYLELYEKIR
jgi:glycosyltransferase involved in cell wall biosynthesis